MSASGPTKQSTQFDSAPDLARTPSNSIEQLFQEGVRAQSSGNAEEAFRIWRQMMTTSGVAERYSTTARKRIRELRTQMIPLRLKQAREANMQGRWQDEICLWKDLLALEPSAQDLAPLLKSPTDAWQGDKQHHAKHPGTSPNCAAERAIRLDVHRRTAIYP